MSTVGTETATPGLRLRRRRAAGGAGFSLIELLTVIVILSILITFLVSRFAGAGDLAKEKLCRGQIQDIGAAISEYESEFGAYPPSRFQDAWGPPPNATNLGAEALVVSLWSPEWGGVTLPEDRLGNTDQDRAKKALSSMPTADLLELLDPWDNPIAYFNRADYDRQDVYEVYDGETGELTESAVRAAVNSTTGRPYSPNSYQLISAGIDGRFGTEDDVTSFQTP